MPTGLDRRRLLLAAFVLFLAATLFMPLPGIPVSLRDLAEAPFGIRSWSRLRLFALSLQPYVSAAALLLLASGAVPALRALREGPERDRRRFDGPFLIGAAMLVAMVQAVAYALLAQNMFLRGLTAPAWLVGLSLLAAEGLLLAVALGASRAAIGNGLALAVLVLWYAPRFALGVLRHGGAGTLIVVPLLVIAYTRILRAGETIPLGPCDAAESATGASPRPVLRLRWNLLGATPGALAASVYMLPVVVATYLSPGSRQALTALLARPWIEGIAETLLCAAASFAFLWVSFDTAYAARLLARHGYRVAGVESADLDAWLWRRLLRRLPVAIALGVLLNLGPGWLASILHVSRALAQDLAWPLFIGTAIVLDTLRHDRALASLAAPGDDESSGGAGGNEPATAAEDAADATAAGDAGAVESESPAESRTDVGSDEAPPEAPAWVTLSEPDTELEAELMRARLARRAIEARVLCNRAVALTGSFAPWEWARPRAASLAIHRRLGGGSVRLVVRGDDEEGATALLAESIPVMPAGDGQPMAPAVST